MRYTPARHVRWIDHGSSVIVLCLKAGIFVGLHGSARVVWNLLLDGKSEHEIAEELRKDQVVSGEIAVAVGSFLESCLKRGLLELDNVSASSIARHSPKVTTRARNFRQPSLMRAIAAILTTRALLNFSGFGGAYSSAIALSERFDAKTFRETRPIGPAVRLFLVAEGFVPSALGQNDCLARSLALFRFLRAIGAPVVHHIGVTEHPFQAHAWVSFEDEALLSDSQQLRQYISIAHLPARPS